MYIISGKNYVISGDAISRFTVAAEHFIKNETNVGSFEFGIAYKKMFDDLEELNKEE